ncbi:MAG: HlyD family type I secretion periplasmic adaptor subunit [Gammaproteobacteria bacterium]|nr:HlyD family type I secretion periplasmic adaptor subunit [Gammaproteobacteria bacterium]
MSLETDFLPAALEIERVPPPVAVRATLWLILWLFCCALAWAIIGRVDIVAVAPGRIVPSGRVKVVQPFEAGIVREILVHEGKEVRAGQPLLRLDPTLPAADLGNLRGQQAALVAEQGRLRQVLAEIDSDGADTATPALIAGGTRATFSTPLHQERIRAAADAILAEQTALENDLRARGSERRAAADQVVRLDSTVPLITERAAALQAMADRNLVPRMQWLEVEELRVAQFKQRDAEANRVAMLDADIAALEQRLRGRRQEVRSRLLEELARVERERAALRQEEIKASRRLAWQTLTAPVSGTVHGLAVHTTGGVVTPAQELLRIVPDDAVLEVEVWVRNQDIGFVRPGSRAVIKIEAFPFTKYGVIQGDVIGVAADAVPHEQLGPVFPARVHMASASLDVDGKPVRLAPGMAVAVEVNLGQRRIIEFLLGPLLRYRGEGLRER